MERHVWNYVQTLIFLGRNIYVRFKFSCVSSSHGLCARLDDHWRWPFQSSSRFPFLCRSMYPIGTSEQQQCYELLNFIIQLDLIKFQFSWFSGVARKWCEGHNMNFPLLPCPGFCLVNLFTWGLACFKRDERKCSTYFSLVIFEILQLSWQQLQNA